MGTVSPTKPPKSSTLILTKPFHPTTLLPHFPTAGLLHQQAGFVGHGLSTVQTFHTFPPFTPFNLSDLSTFHTFHTFPPFHLSDLSTFHTFPPFTPFHLSTFQTFHTFPPFRPFHLSHHSNYTPFILATLRIPITLMLSVIFPSSTICSASLKGSFQTFRSASVSSGALAPS